MTRLRAGLTVFFGWTTLALFFAVSTSLTYRSTGRPGNWRLTITRALSEWWLWGLLTPLIVALARRFPLHGGQRLRNAVVHLAAGACIAVLKTSADRLTFALLTGVRMYWLVSTLALQFAIYAAVVAAAHGLEYYRRSREREQLEAQLSETRLQMLNLQLQPHFLFNTLNTIAEMVHEDPESADLMIGRLGDLLRRTLDLGTIADITLEEEFDLVSRYLDIQRARFGERLRARLSMSDAVRSARVPALLLQPIVENAIRHGLATRLDAGSIDIEARRESDTVVITVTDDGAGAGQTPPAEGIGLGNTRARLRAMYGDGARLTLAPGEGRGARVRIEIPQ